MKFPEESLLFAVLDGEDPVKWQPWSGEQLNFGTLRQQWVDRAAGKTPPPNQPATSFLPLTDPVEEILSIGRTRRVVGAIIEATAEPDDAAHYHEKMTRLRDICVGIKQGAETRPPLIDKVGFEIWFVVDDPDILRWEEWSQQARTTVQAVLKQTPNIRWARRSENFFELGEELLIRSRSNLLYGLG
ncbi:MAG: hypothetical protein JJ901_03245 [Erythrobacter sp.]|uniref:hypothetical protein n=1 Tax=Erythrobacter sp. TaxID=1042 RepID=UPI001B20667A|nr:hypothetical protein [Erythrobacter sp.]MBO6767304.1 hypothetical protein [Erythrobacter sp.]